MPGLFGMLNLGSRALGVQSAAIEITGNNIANASTEGYHRQQISIRPAQIVAGFGQGSMMGGVRRAYNQFTENQVLLQTSTSAHYKLRSDVLQVTNAQFNESTTAGISGALDDFYASISDLATFPDSGAVRTTTLGAAQTVARRFNDLSGGLSDLKDQLDTQISADVLQANQLLVEVGRLNSQIAQVQAKGESAANLMDQRAQVVSSLNGLVNTRVTVEDDGQMTINIGGFAVVQDGEVHELMTAPDADNDDHLMILVTASNGDVRELTSSIDSGSMGSALELRDQTLTAYAQELDTLAYDFATRVNEIHSSGYGMDGLSGRNLFDVSATVAGAAAALRVSADVDGQPDALAAAADPADLPGGSTNAIALYATSSEVRPTLGNLTFHDYYAHLSAQVGSDAKSAEQQQVYEDNQLYELQSLNQSQSGVNLDEEAAELQKYQSGYQAAAKFVSTVKEMLDVLMQM